MLTTIVSGRARADILRAHLSLPTVRFLEKYSDSAVSVQSARTTLVTGTAPTQDAAQAGPDDRKLLTVAHSFSDEHPIANTSFLKTPIVNTSFSESPIVNSFNKSTEKPSVLMEKPHQVVGPDSPVFVRRTGMAAMLIDKGVREIGES